MKFTKIEIPLSGDVQERLQVKLQLEWIARNPFKLTIDSTKELNQFIDTIAYWSQPCSIGDEAWPQRYQQEFNTVLIQVLRAHMRYAA